jgi:glutamate racemase
VRDAPIGILDSGVGGLTVARSIIDQLPQESIYYIGDTEHGPYGPRPLAEVREYALAIMDHLVAFGVKAIVIACNTASAAVLHDARERYQIPVIEVVRPAVRRAVSVTKNGKVGVIGTAATIKSGAYPDAFAAAPNIEVITKACPMFVEFVERGETTGEEVIQIAHEYLDDLVERGIDTLVLGCTHYPLLTAVISYVVGPKISLVSSAEETAQDLFQALLEKNLLRPSGSTPPIHVFAATKNAAQFQELAKRFLGPVVQSATQVSI